MFLPRRDFDCDYDHPDFKMPWWMIAAQCVGLPPLLLLASPIVLVASLFGLLVSLFGRAPPLDRDDPIRQTLAKARRV